MNRNGTATIVPGLPTGCRPFRGWYFDGPCSHRELQILTNSIVHCIYIILARLQMWIWFYIFPGFCPVKIHAPPSHKHTNLHIHVADSLNRSSVLSYAGRVSFPRLLPLGGKQLCLWLHFFCNVPVFFPLVVGVIIVITHHPFSVFSLIPRVFCAALSVFLIAAIYPSKIHFLRRSTFPRLGGTFDGAGTQSNRIDIINYLLADLFWRH